LYVGAPHWTNERDLVIHLEDSLERGNSLFGGALRGREAHEAVARPRGCVAYASVPYVERGPAVPEAERLCAIEGAYLRLALGEDRREDIGDLNACLVRGLGIALGLHLKPDIAGRFGRLGETELAEIEEALRALYHPAVRSGMTREAFVSALARVGAIGERGGRHRAFVIVRRLFSVISSPPFPVIARRSDGNPEVFVLPPAPTKKPWIATASPRNDDEEGGGHAFASR
jgi:hypothetical protein